MLITCPSCAARYDVPDTLIAANGRHVQCTACHTRWFERPSAGSQSAASMENEILARLEARGGTRSRVITDLAASASAGPQPEKMASRTATPAGSAAETTSEGSLRVAGPHLRLVEPEPGETAPDTAELSEAEDSAVPEEFPPTSPHDPADDRRAAHPKQDPGRGSTVSLKPAPIFRPARLDPAPAPSGRPRIELEAPPPVEEEGDESVAAYPRSSRWRVLAASALVILAALYLAADQLAAYVPALQPALEGYVDLLEAVAGYVANWLAFVTEGGSNQ